MRITIVTLGTRGDVQPMTVLACALRDRGHEVVMGVPPNLVDFTKDAGFETRTLGPDTQAFVDSPTGQKMMASPNAISSMLIARRIADDLARQISADLVSVCEGAEALVCGGLGEAHVLALAQAKGGLPLAAIHFFPQRRTSAFPHFLVTTRQLRRPAWNAATFTVMDYLMWWALRPETNRFRFDLGLPPAIGHPPKQMADHAVLELQAYSRTLTPGVSDYGPRRPIVGFLEPSEQLLASLAPAESDPETEAWVRKDTPPIYVGFGSMPVPNPQAVADGVREVTRRLGVRALVCTGNNPMSGFDPSDDQIRVVKRVDHVSIFPLCRVVVHHGGAGTTACATRSDVPSLIYFVAGDQAFWGSRIQELGIGRCRPLRDFNTATFNDDLQALLDPRVSAKAAELGAALRAEPSAADTAADLLEAEFAARGPWRRAVESETDRQDAPH